jgi:hypothetical protein
MKSELTTFEIARVLVRFNHVASFIENADHCVMRAAAMLCVSDCVYDCICITVQEVTK